MDENNNTGYHNTGNYNTGYHNTGNYSTGDHNTGNYNTGNYNTGYRNTGYRNTGDRSTGNHNTGNYNTGYRNTGYRNTGDRSTGNYNTGDHNTGNYNTGYRNTGNYNTGNYNTGYRSTGYHNTGNYNTGDHNTGDCNTDQPTVRMFNKDSGLEFFCEKHSEFRNILFKYSLPLCEWVSESNMSDTEKSDYRTYKTTGGYLKVNEKTFNGKDIEQDDIDFLKTLPNFDADILLECTGIDINNQKKKIIVDGKEILISLESFEEIKRQFFD